MNSYGPVNLSAEMLQWFREVDDLIEDATLKDAIEKAPTGQDFGKELALLMKEWGEDYPLDVLMEIDGTGLQTHMSLDEIVVECGFEMDDKQGDGGSGTRKQWMRMDNPIDDQIIVKVTRASDVTKGETTTMPGGYTVRPAYGGGPRDYGHYQCIPTPEEVRDYNLQQADYCVAWDAIEAKIEARFGRDDYNVSYGAPTDDRDVPIDNLHEFAIKGRCILVCDSDHDEPEHGDYQSDVVENPTWLDMCVLMDAMIQRTGDFHHVYLEGVNKTEMKIGGVPVYRFSTGS